MRRMGGARRCRSRLWEDTGTVRKGVCNRRKLSEYASQASFELLIGLHQLILPKALRQLRKV